MISGPSWSSTLFASLSGKGFVGTKLMDLTDAVGIGGATHVVGKPFVTIDSGTIPGTGVGVGVGIIALIGSLISTLIFSQAVSLFGQAGAKLMDLTDSVGDACVSELALATLMSMHPVVFSGGGIITPGTILVIGAAWGSAVDAEGAAKGFIGSEWSNLATAIGTGQATHVAALGTGTVVITGSPTGPPVPGAGAGTGVIS